MPLAIIDGALCIHPVAHMKGASCGNPFYDGTAASLEATDRSRRHVETRAVRWRGGDRARSAAARSIEPQGRPGPDDRDSRPVTAWVRVCM